MRLIDADALVHDLIHNRSFYPVCVRKAIEDAPTVDAVPVVRCKDCRKRDTEECTMEYKYEEYPWKATKDNDFCSGGERRTDGKTDRC